MKPLRVGVVGVGHIGRHHARILAELPNVELVGVADADLEAARIVADQLAVQAYSHAGELVGLVDAVSVATPTVHHYPVACEFLRQGIGTLVEKPLAFSVNEAREMVRLAAEHDAILQVGHVERFNPSWTALESRLDADDPPTFVEAHRFSEYPFRSIDVSVVFDLMIHDLDLALQMIPAAVSEVDAVGASVISPSVDQAEARLQFENGSVAIIAASRVHDRPVRQLRYWSRSQSGQADLFRRTVTTRQLVGSLGDTLPAELNADQKKRLLGKLFQDETTTLDRTAEPLRAELENFVESVRNRTAPKVTGEQGCELVSLATRIEAAIRNNQAAGLKLLRKSA